MVRLNWGGTIVTALAFALAAGCNLDSSKASPQDSQSGGTAAATTSSSRPSISGTSARTVVVGSSYFFQPSAQDPNGDRLTYAISGMPSWATFDTATGILRGTPVESQIGSYNNIVISVSDGSNTVSLTAFNLTVIAVGTGTATLSWSPPTVNTDGTSLTNLGGYRIYFGTSEADLNDMVEVDSPGITSYVVQGLVAGTHYFAISAFNSSGVESAMKMVGSKTIM